MPDPGGRKAAHPSSTNTPGIWRSPRLASPDDDYAIRHARVLDVSLPAMESLYRQLDNAALTILFCDTDGQILSMVGASAPAAASPGDGDAPAPADIGTAATRLPAILHDRPASGIPSVHADAASVDPGLLGIATPILSPDAELLGVIGVLGFFGPHQSRTDNLSHPNALLQTTAEIIEHRLIENDERGFLVLGFHPRRGVLGSPLEALAVFDRDSRLLSANRVARRLLALGDDTPDAHCMDFFESHWHTLVAYAALCIADPFTLRTRDGMPLFARAILR